MNDGAFQWDDDKAIRNLALHGVPFTAARAVFLDPFALEWIDDREDYGEERFVILGMVDRRLLVVVYTMRGEAIRIISARGAEPHERRRYHDDDACSTEHDWTRFDAMSEDERHAAALRDLDVRPLAAADMQRMRRTPQVRIIRRALGLSQEAFAERFHIPLGTLRDWEQGRKDPDAAARAYLTVIGRNPAAVSEALSGAA